MQEKEFIRAVRCELKIPSLGITVRHHEASKTEFSIRIKQPLKFLNSDTEREYNTMHS